MRSSLRDHAAYAAIAFVLSCTVTPPAAAETRDDVNDIAARAAAIINAASHAGVEAVTQTHGVLPAPSAVTSNDSNTATVRRSHARWVWPQEGSPTVHAKFDAPDHRYGPGHRGIDITGSGTTVHAVENGVVHYAGSVGGKPVVSIMHSDGLLSTYEPVIASVSQGDQIQAGQKIGTLQLDSPYSHCSTTCLHLGARINEKYIDPLPLLGVRGPSVLYPGGEK